MPYGNFTFAISVKGPDACDAFSFCNPCSCTQLIIRSVFLDNASMMPDLIVGFKLFAFQSRTSQDNDSHEVDQGSFS